LHLLKFIGADMEWLTMVPADFCSDDVEAKLSNAGHDVDCPNLLVCEGLLVYLDQQVDCKLLVGLRSWAAVGSVLATSLGIHRAGVDSDEVAIAVNTGRRTGESEPWLTILPIDSYITIFRHTGWSADCIIDSLKLDTCEIDVRMALITAKPNSESK
jgi:O-methyltransferase involved in polyketide biosynthesis